MKRMLLMAFSLFMLMMSWEGQLTSANVLDNGPIPQESVRLRIIANSDSVQDQWLKREVRDAIIAQMNTWADDIETLAEAEQVIQSQLPVLQQVVDKTIKERGFSYKAVVDFGEVPFPTKLYGSYVYPAGNYRAVRVQIGEAKGQNWWCVLFPPLCFIDMSNGDAVQAKPTPEPEQSEQTTVAVSEEKEVAVFPLEENEVGLKSETNKVDAEQMKVEVEETEEVEKEEEVTASAPEVEVRFYLWEKIEGWLS
ncbi:MULTISPECIES: stage II sporulation protein R [Brevibacillus]|uniref:stage II sporulation protein R n=1 Tax=Brevibacillus TaxID=55080 RepID=UPI001E30567A|nr:MULTISPECIES: stage II sporulation protein R [Brevibacillus]MCE0451241.1 stage II sporulation protein R [Brevibacillus sp. AF8]UKL00789.1 stage II sporulation protein R [Brevibacillus brevis]